MPAARTQERAAGADAEAAADEPPASDAALVAELRSHLASLDRVRAERRRARERHQERTEALRARLRRLEADLAREEERSPEAELATARTTLEAREAAASEDALRIERIASAWSAAARRAVERIRAGIPYQRDERAAALEEPANALAADTLAARVRGLTSLFQAASDELRRTREREVWSQHVALPGRNPHAYVARIGLALQLFVTEDLGDAGYLHGAEEAPRLAEGDERVEVIHALQILRGREVPRPVTLRVTRGAATASEDE